MGRVEAAEAAAHQIEELLLIDLADRRAVAASDDVVRADLQVRDRVGPRWRLSSRLRFCW